LATFDVSFNHLSVIPASFGQLSSLSNLSLKFNRFSMLPSSLLKLKRTLQIFKAENNPWSHSLRTLNDPLQPLDMLWRALESQDHGTIENSSERSSNQREKASSIPSRLIRRNSGDLKRESNEVKRASDFDVLDLLKGKYSVSVVVFERLIDHSQKIAILHFARTPNSLVKFPWEFLKHFLEMSCRKK
jgi:Leucine-rich repeat (LRR) protein